jgi:hypothetical protein
VSMCWMRSTPDSGPEIAVTLNAVTTPNNA